MIHLSAETWNRYYPVGTRVLYEPVRDRGEYEERVTRSAAYETQNGPMVQLVGRAGGFLLRHLAPIEIPLRLGRDGYYDGVGGIIEIRVGRDDAEDP